MFGRPGRGAKDDSRWGTPAPGAHCRPSLPGSRAPVDPNCRPLLPWLPAVIPQPHSPARLVSPCFLQPPRTPRPQYACPNHASVTCLPAALHGFFVHRVYPGLPTVTSRIHPPRTPPSTTACVLPPSTPSLGAHLNEGLSKTGRYSMSVTTPRAFPTALHPVPPGFCTCFPHSPRSRPRTC